MQRGNLGIFHFCIRLQVFVYIMAKKQQTHHKEDSKVENQHKYHTHHKEDSEVEKIGTIIQV